MQVWIGPQGYPTEANAMAVDRQAGQNNTGLEVDYVPVALFTRIRGILLNDHAGAIPAELRAAHRGVPRMAEALQARLGIIDH